MHTLLSFSIALLLCGSMCSAETDAPRVITSGAPDLNRAIVALTRSMPKGGGYATTSLAAARLRSSVALAPGGGFGIEPAKAQPSYCSGATYLVFLKLVQQLERYGALQLDPAAMHALLIAGQPDGTGVWGRWNANGPGTARLFHELGAGRNFLSYDEARPGDFMKIFWTREIGKRERGHSVIFLGTEVENGVEMVRFWSSNKPGGYGEKVVPRSKVALAVFSRLERPANIARAAQLPKRDAYLASLLTTPSTLAELKAKCGM